MTGDSVANAYDGPIVDAHHHMWDFSLGRHPWLAGDDPGLAPLQRNVLPKDYLEAIAGHNVVASVHIEANWDPADPLGETRWLESLERPEGIAARYVAYVPLAREDAAELIEGHAACDRVVGVREILTWHPDPGKRRHPDGEAMDSARWRSGLALFEHYNLSFDLLISPWQLGQARRLAEAFPHLQFVVNHCGSPMDRDAEGMERWRKGLKELAGAPNVAIKISNAPAYDPDWSYDSLSEVILTCIDAFGPERSIFASDHPVMLLGISFDKWVEVFKRATASFSADEKRAMFHDNARRVYRL